MKRWPDRDAVEPEADRDAPAQGPLPVEPLSARGRRLRYALPIAIGAIVLVTGVAFVGKYVDQFRRSAAEVTPAPPTPISWIDTTVAPTASPASTASPADSPSASVVDSPASAPSDGRVRTVRVQMTTSMYWYRHEANHFTVTLTNTSGAPMPLDPCPTYRTYIFNPNAPEGPTRVLNCAAIGAVLAPGQSVSLDMQLSISRDDPGGYQLIAWKLVSPPGFQAFGTLKNVFIQQK